MLTPKHIADKPLTHTHTTISTAQALNGKPIHVTFETLIPKPVLKPEPHISTESYTLNTWTLNPEHKNNTLVWQLVNICNR